ncbi:hypothetical protein ES695_14485 [Candidatus Atribacteria bacterium 1244-E10-H5-B2]|nr:MAG: hypothetical protein ES695_14485 [Candidatus Atribacteria bacterium 1244-E10-H5-B2]
MSKLLNKYRGANDINIKVFCKVCNWTGQAIVGKRGFDLEKYKCPDCGRSGLKRGKGSYDPNSGHAVLKK